MFSFEVFGVDAVEKRVLAEIDARRLRAAAELQRFGEDVMAVSKEEYVPVDTGFLRSSGQVEPVVFDGAGRASVRLTYGADYADVVHEDLTANHPHGQAKYLEVPLFKLLPTLGKRLAAAARGNS